MTMTASLQEKIAPPNTIDRRIPEGNIGPAKIEGDAKKIDFKDLLINSNDEERSKRQAQKNGDLSKSANYEDFIDNLNKQTQEKRMPKSDLGKDDFLTLFVTQLQNQDPLNPKDGAEMASQLAQFNSLEQMLNVNKTLKSLEEKTDKQAQVQFINYVGKEAFIADGRISLKSGKNSQASVELENPVSKVTMQIKDSAGQTVVEKVLGSLPSGKQNISWDGKDKDGKAVSDGVYTLSLKGIDANNSEIQVPVLSKATIEGVDLKGNEGGGFYTDLGRVSMLDLVKVGNVGFSKELTQEVKQEAKPIKDQQISAPEKGEFANEQSLAQTEKVPKLENKEPPAKQISAKQIQAPFATAQALNQYQTAGKS